jgi:oxygen-independent coproporphyrinogen-3 oxidase
MAGIYIHIPFCKQACHYCDFHFSVNRETSDRMVNAIIRELQLRKDYLADHSIHTIYFGGGTPSLLAPADLEKIFSALHAHFQIDNQAEITLEANPDDLSGEKISSLKKTPINRLSIGIQSFFEDDLKWMNRAHTASQSTDAVKLAQDAGFNNISIDLIYGLPGSTDHGWEENLERAFALNVQHLSCYCLTVEPRTALATFIKNGKSPGINEDQAARQFEILMQRAKDGGWKHYEISNFCRDNYFSRHNTSYWSGEKYLGLGPSAHSFNGLTRQWNISHNLQYIQGIEKDVVPAEVETLTSIQRLNEYIMTSLRTMWEWISKELKKLLEKPCLRR